MTSKSAHAHLRCNYEMLAADAGGSSVHAVPASVQSCIRAERACSRGGPSPDRIGAEHEDVPSHVVGFHMVVDTVEASLRDQRARS